MGLEGFDEFILKRKVGKGFYYDWEFFYWI